MTLDRGRSPAPRSGPPRKGQLSLTVASLAAACLGLVGWTLWRSHGSQLALLVCTAAAVMLVVDAVWAVLATRPLKMRVTANPPDVQVGDTYSIGLAVEGPRREVLLNLAFPGAGPVRLEPPLITTPSSTALRRAVMAALPLNVASSGICGLVAHARLYEVPMSRPMAIGPRPLAPPDDLRRSLDDWGDAARYRRDEGDVVHGVRDYVPGDARRQVHWRATARRGQLVMKEVERPEAPRLVLTLDLGSGGDAGEEAAGRAAWYALEALARGHDVVLATAEGERAVTAPVSSPSDVNRRLAAATVGRPAPPPGPQLLVTPNGDSWR